MSLIRINKKSSEWKLPSGQLTTPPRGQQTTKVGANRPPKLVVNRPPTKESKDNIKKKTEPTAEPFPLPTEEQKKELATLAVALTKRKFNIYVFISKVKKAKGYFPPIDAMIKISKAAEKASPENLWGYFTKALQTELPKHFAELNIREHEKYKQESTKIGDIMIQMSRTNKG